MAERALSEETTFLKGEATGDLSNGADTERLFWFCPSRELGLRRMKDETALRGEIITKLRGLRIVYDFVEDESEVTTIVCVVDILY